MDTSFLKDWSLKLNVVEDVLAKQFEQAKNEMQSHFPNQSPEVIFEKAKLKLKVDHKRAFLSGAVPFIGIVIGSESPRDPLTRIRQNQLGRYEKAKEQSDKMSDPSILQREIDNQVVRIDSDEKVVPLWPKLKSNGEPNKLAGKDLPEPENSMVQTIYAIGTPVDKKSAKGIVLELRGKACGQNLHKGKIVSFKAMNRTKADSKLYELSTNQTEFVLTNDEYMETGLEKVENGLIGMIKKCFADNLVDWNDINKWVAEKKANPKKDVVPDKYKNEVMILEDSMCVYQNFNPDAKNRIKINLCGTGDDVEDVTILCLADKQLDDSIDFAQNSKVIAIGRPWLPEPNPETGDMTFFLMTSGMFAYPEWKIPRVDTKKLSEKELLQNVKPEEVKVEEKPKIETKEDPTPEKPKEEVW